MADVSINVPHSKEITEVQAIVATVLDRMGEKMGLNISWSGTTATLSGKAIKSGTVQVEAQSVVVDITLSLFAKPMKGMVESMIHQKFEKHLA